MASLSLPLRVALAALLALSGIWFAVLRPGAAPVETEAFPAPPAASAPASTPAPAAPSAPAATGGQAAPAETPAAAQPKSAPKADRPPADPSLPLLTAIDEGRAAVLLFTDGRAPEDAAARRAVDGLDRRGGRVVVRRSPMAEVGRYEAITRGVMVTASPTILVIGPSHTARPIVGVTSRGEVDQAVSDALDFSTDPVAEARFNRAQAVRRAVRTCEGDKACVTHFTAANDACVAAVQGAMQGAVAGAAAQGTALAALQGARAGAAQLATQFAAVSAPATLKDTKARGTALLQGQLATFDKLLASSKDGAVVAGRVRRSPQLRRSDRELRRLGYAACG